MLKKLLILSVLSFSVFAQAKPALIEMIENKASVHEVQTAIQQGVDINAREGIFSKKRSVLMIAIKNKRPEIVKLLLASGVYMNERDKDGITPLMYAVNYGSSEVVNLLLQGGASVNARDKEGFTALIFAGYLFSISLNEEVNIVKLLLAYGADVNAKSDELRLTPLMAASLYAQSDLVKLLLQAGADVNARDKDGYTALTYLDQNSFKKIFSSTIFVDKVDYQGTAQALKQAGATR